MNFFAFWCLLSSIASFILGLLIYFKNRNLLVNKICALLNLSVAIWNLGYFGSLLSSTKESALIWSRFVLYGGTIFIPVLFLHFTLVFLNLKQKKLLYFSYVCTFIFLIFNFGTSLFIKGMSKKFIFKFYSEPGVLYHYFLVFFGVCIIYSFYLMFKEHKISSLYKRNQIKYVFLASIIGFLGGSTNYPLIYGIKLFPFGQPFVFLYPLIITYAILRYRLMDITVTITRTGVFLAIYTLILGLPFILATWGKPWLIEVLKANWWMGPLVLMAILATVGPFVFIYLQRKAEARLLREQRRYQETLRQAAVGMTRIRDLNKLLNLIVHIVTKTVRITHSAIYLYDPKSEQFLLEAARNLKKSQMPSISKKTTLMVWLQSHPEPLVYEEIRRRFEDNPANLIFKEMEEQMQALQASVLVPSFLEERLIGFLILGDKRSGGIYSSDDLDIFLVLASQAALAIENAQFIIEAKVMQEQIAQAEKMATIGTMADGLSHQINNRLHALLMITGDTLDTLKLTDTKDYPQEAKEILGQIKYALSRIQANVLQGKEVVEGLLKYSRKAEQGFSAVGLDEIISGALEMIKFKRDLSKIEIVRNFPDSLPKIKGNPTQLQETFFNFIDNAYDAILDQSLSTKEKNYRGRITISGLAKDNLLEVCVEDNGIGIKPEDKHKLFTPFFTTKASSRKGTGLGLYVIKRIIEEFHQGRIWFESEYGKGTRFFLELPIAK